MKTLNHSCLIERELNILNWLSKICAFNQLNCVAADKLLHCQCEPNIRLLDYFTEDTEWSRLPTSHLLISKAGAYNLAEIIILCSCLR